VLALTSINVLLLMYFDLLYPNALDPFPFVNLFLSIFFENERNRLYVHGLGFPSAHGFNNILNRRINTSLLHLLILCWLRVHAASYSVFGYMLHKMLNFEMLTPLRSDLFCIIIPAPSNSKVVKIGVCHGRLVGFDSFIHFPFSF